MSDRSRSPVPRTHEQEEEVEVTEATASTTQALAPVGKPGRLPPTYYTLDFSNWQLTTSGRNKYGGLNWNIRSPVYEGTTFNFHAGDDEENYDAWSTQPWEVKAETQEGAPDNTVKLSLEVNERQVRWVQGFEEWLLDTIEKQSMDVLNVKQAVKKELIASQHFKSLITPATETRPARVKFNFFVANREKLGVMHYFRLNPDGETYNSKPQTLRGWNQIQPVIEGHNLRGAKVRAISVRTWNLNVVKKEIYPSFEILEMYVKEPKSTRAYGGELNVEQRMTMLNWD